MRTQSTSITADDLAAVGRCKAVYDRIRAELAAVIVGQDEMIEQVLIATFAGGHALLEGVPGLAKTLLLRSLAEAAELSFRRIQCTPDLLPGDIIGTQVLQEDPDARRHYQFQPGPLFANVLLVEEFNRTPPRTQAAVLEAMQERQITSAGQVYKLPAPFFVLATQNPAEQEDSHALHAAQLDHFLLHIKVGYPEPAEEWEMARQVTGGERAHVAPLLSGEEFIELQKLVRRMPVTDQVLGYAWALVRATRPGTSEAVTFVDKWVSWGVGPRGMLALITCAKARAVLHGRCQAAVEDVQWLIKPALRHRIAGSFAAQASNLDSDRLIEILLEHVSTDENYKPPAM